MTIEGYYPEGQEVAVYKAKDNLCYKAKVVGSHWGRMADHFPYVIYKLQLEDDTQLEAPFAFVFAKEDWDGQHLHHHQKTHFEVDTEFYHHDPEAAEEMIIQTLTAEGK